MIFPELLGLASVLLVGLPNELPLHKDYRFRWKLTNLTYLESLSPL